MSSQTGTPVANPHDTVQAMIAAVAVHDAGAIAGLYAADAVILGSGRPAVNGRSMLYFTLGEGGWLISADMWQPVP